MSTSIFQRIISEFLSQGGHIKNICRVQFNDHRLNGIKFQDLSSIEDAYFFAAASSVRSR